MKGLKSTDTAYLLEEGLEKLHKETQLWVSEIVLWKEELKFFQKLLDNNSQKMSKDEKVKLDHFQNLIIYYDGELLDQFAKNARKHEKNLATNLEKGIDVDESGYRMTHNELKNEIESFKKQFYEYKHEFFEFMAPVI